MQRIKHEINVANRNVAVQNKLQITHVVIIVVLIGFRISIFSSYW